MADRTLDIATFRKEYPEFADETAFPDERLNWAFRMAMLFLTDRPSWAFKEAVLSEVLNLATAHILALTGPSGAGVAGSPGVGSSGGILTAATIDKVQVQFAPPPTKGGLQFWLAQTAYGQMLWALLRKIAAPGAYVGGLPEKRGFRRVGGVFTDR